MMNRLLIETTRKRIRRLYFLIQNEKERAAQSAAFSIYERHVHELEAIRAELINKVTWIQRNEMTFWQKIKLFFENSFFYCQDWLRQFREKQVIIHSDKQYIKNILSHKAESPGDYYFEVDIKQDENKKTEIVGEREILIKNNKTDKEKKYQAGASAANDWHHQLVQDVENGFYDKAG